MFKSIQNRKRQKEDTLKFIFDCEYNQTDCNISSIAGNLNVSMDEVETILNQLTRDNLVTLNNQSVLLTDTGRNDALRIVRAHRLMERYLADQTGVDPSKWHKEALRIQNLLSEDEIETLAAKMGNPVFDPHGDPIPSAEGILPKQRGVLLNTLQKGDSAIIFHLEDEPHSIYEQILRLGLYPGMKIYVEEVANQKVIFVAEGKVMTLTSLSAGYITVEKVSGDSYRHIKYDLLANLELGEGAEVSGISPNVRVQQRRRLMDLGIIPGSRISAVIRSASGDPTGYKVMGTVIGIRKQQAQQIFIKRKRE